MLKNKTKWVNGLRVSCAHLNLIWVPFHQNNLLFRGHAVAIFVAKEVGFSVWVPLGMREESEAKAFFS